MNAPIVILSGAQRSRRIPLQTLKIPLRDPSTSLGMTAIR